jgi:urea transport system permease protein
MQSWLTTSYPDVWLLFLGALFMGVVLFFPDGVVGGIRRLIALITSRRATSTTPEAAPGTTPVTTVR